MASSSLGAGAGPDDDVEHNIDMPIPPLPATIEAEDFAKLSQQWTTARANAAKAVAVTADFQLSQEIIGDEQQKANVYIAQKWTPARFVPTAAKPPPMDFYELDGLAIKYDNRGTVSRCFGPLLDQDRFGPERFELGMLVCDGCSNSSGEIVEIIEHPVLGPLYRQVWLDRTAGSQLYDGMFYPRSQLRLKTTGKREIAEDYYIPLREMDKAKVKDPNKKTRSSSATVFPVDRTFLSGWTDSDMASLKPKDRVKINGGNYKVLRNDRTQRALVVVETDPFGGPLFPPDADRGVKCDTSLSYYEDVDLKTPESQRFVEIDKRLDNERPNRMGRKFKLREGAASSVGTVQSATTEDQDIYDDGLNPQPEQVEPEPNPTQPKPPASPHAANMQTTSKVKLDFADAKKPAQLNATGNVLMSAENFEALQNRIIELEKANTSLKTQALVIQLENKRNEQMVNHFVGTMQKIAQDFNYNSDQQRIQTDRLEGLGNQFTSQGRELARCRTEMVKMMEKDLGRMSEKWQSQFVSSAQGSHEVLTSARLSANKQISGLEPMTSPAHFTPSPKARDVNSKRSLTSSFDDQAPSASGPPRKKAIVEQVEPAEPAWTDETIASILSKHGVQAADETITLDEVSDVLMLENELDQQSTVGQPQQTPLSENPINKTPLSQRGPLPPVPKAIKKMMTSAPRSVRPQFHHGVDSPTSHVSIRTQIHNPPPPELAVSGPPTLEPEVKQLSAKCLAYMKEIDRGMPNGLNKDCKRPFDYHGDPVYKSDHFTLVYAPLCLSALGDDQNMASNQILAAYMYFEGVSLDTFSELPQDYKERETRRHLQKCRSQFFGGNTQVSNPIPYTEEKVVHHLYPFHRNVNADLALHSLLHAWVRHSDVDDEHNDEDDDDHNDEDDDDDHNDDDDEMLDYTPQAQPQTTHEPNTEAPGASGAQSNPPNNTVASSEWAPDSGPEDEYGSGYESETSNTTQNQEVLVLKDSKSTKLGGGGMNKILEYPNDDGLLEGTPLPLEITINQFMDKLRKGKLVTYVPESVVQNVCNSCMAGVKGKDPLKAWQSVFSTLLQHVIKSNPPRGYWHSRAGTMVVDRELLKDSLIRCRGYMKAVVRAKDMVPARFSTKDVHEMHYLACRHFEFVFEIFRHLRKMAKKVTFPQPNTYNFYLAVIDNARRNLNKRKHEAKQKTKTEDSAGPSGGHGGGNGSNGAKERSALAAELDLL